MRKLTKDHNTDPIDIDEVAKKYKTIAEFSASLDNHMGLEEIYVDIGRKDMNQGDVILLASDGLTKIIKPSNLRKFLLSSEDPDLLKKEIGDRVYEISDYTKQYAAFKNITPEKAAKKLIDDTTFVMIMRTE